MQYIYMVEITTVSPKVLLEKVREVEQSLAKLAVASEDIPVNKIRVIKQGNRSYIELTPFGIKPGTNLLSIKVKDTIVFIIEKNE
jgi:hypothetical protein